MNAGKKSYFTSSSGTGFLFIVWNYFPIKNEDYLPYEAPQYNLKNLFWGTCNLVKDREDYLWIW